MCKRERDRESYIKRECVRVCAYVCVRGGKRESESVCAMRERKRDG